MKKMMRSAVVAAIAGCALALSAGGVGAAPLCSTITTIGAWAQADGGCDIGDKNWDLNSTSTSLLPTAAISFTLVGDVYAMQVTGFDTSTSAGAWNINYTITVLNPLFFISDMFAGADNPGGGSLLTKSVTGDPGGPFLLTDTNGAEGPTSEKHGLTATALTVDENFSVDASKTLLSVSDTFIQTETIRVPEPGTLLLLAIGMLGAGWIGRRAKRA